MRSNDHNEIVREAFTSQADRFNRPGTNVTSQEYLDWALSNIRTRPDMRALDVAAGTGIVSRAIAPLVARVTAIDYTPAMLERARIEAEKIGISNIDYMQGLAESLPFADAAFDLIVTRLSLHHFQDPQPAFMEMVRALAPGGQLAIIDLLSPDDEALADKYNHYERLRDPSHTWALTRDQYAGLFELFGLEILSYGERGVDVQMAQWFELSGSGEDVRALILAACEQELSGGEPCGLRPRREADGMHMTQTWAYWVARKQP